MAQWCGLDFGTSNTAIQVGTAWSLMEPSLIYFPPPAQTQEIYVGRRAQQEYVARGMKGRFIQSIKSLLPDHTFHSTVIFGRRYSPENLAAVILRHFREAAQEATGSTVQRVVLGRPVRFSSDSLGDSVALQRLEAAAGMAGFRMTLVNDDLGYALLKAVEDTKCELSQSSQASLRFNQAGITIEEPLDRDAFTSMIQDELHRALAEVDGTLLTAGVGDADVDLCFLTGGTSQVPLVARLFRDHYGAQRVRHGSALKSVIEGLARFAGLIGTNKE